MEYKKCFKCNTEKSLDDFYKHSQMKDGHVNKCKECNKKDVSENYFKRHDYYIEYDNSRIDNPQRREYRKNHAKYMRDNFPEKVKEYHKKYDKKKKYSTTLVHRAVQKDKIKKLPCEVCGDLKSEGHHENYDKPLQVKWLCRTHHMLRHREINKLN